jgi:hypothetical protein
MSSDRRHVPGRLMFEDGIEDDEQFMHTGDELLEQTGLRLRARWTFGGGKELG